MGRSGDEIEEMKLMCNRNGPEFVLSSRISAASKP